MEEYPPYLRSIMLERLLPATEYSLHVVAVYLGKYRLFSEQVQFISPTDNESRRFKENTYRPIHRYPDEDKRELGIGLAQVRSEELTIVAIAVIFWIATIYLFFNKWGKIRMLEPYQPAYREASPAPFAHHHPSAHNLAAPPIGSGSGGGAAASGGCIVAASAGGIGALAGIGAKMGGFCAAGGSGPSASQGLAGAGVVPVGANPTGASSETPAPLANQQHPLIAAGSNVGANSGTLNGSMIKMSASSMATGELSSGQANCAARISEGQLCRRTARRNLLLLGNKRFETIADDLPPLRRTEAELNYLFQSKAHALARASSLWPRRQQQQQLRARLLTTDQASQGAGLGASRSAGGQVSALLRQRGLSQCLAGRATRLASMDSRSSGAGLNSPDGGFNPRAARKESAVCQLVAARPPASPVRSLARGSSMCSTGSQLLRRFRNNQPVAEGSWERTQAASLDRQQSSASDQGPGGAGKGSAECDGTSSNIGIGKDNGSDIGNNSNKLRRLLFMNRSHHHHHVATSTSSSTLQNTANQDGGAPAPQTSPALKSNSASLDEEGAQRAAAAAEFCEPVGGANSIPHMVSTSSLSSASLPSNMMDGRTEDEADSETDGSQSESGSLIRLAGQMGSGKGAHKAHLVEHHILIEPPSPPNKLQGGGLATFRQPDSGPRQERQACYSACLEQILAGGGDVSQANMAQADDCPTGRQLARAGCNKSPTEPRASLLSPDNRRPGAEFGKAKPMGQSRHQIEFGQRQKQRLEQDPSNGNEWSLEFASQNIDICDAFGSRNKPDSCPTNEQQQPEICLERPPSDRGEDAFAKLASYQGQRKFGCLHAACQLSQDCDYLRHQSSCRESSGLAGGGNGGGPPLGGKAQFACLRSSTERRGQQPSGSSERSLRFRMETGNEESNLGARAGLGECRPRMSSVFVASPYSRAHRDSFALLRALSQKKSKSAEDIAYLSSLVLQIWVRDRNPLLQSASHQQLSNAGRRQSSARLEESRLRNKRPKSSLTVSHI